MTGSFDIQRINRSAGREDSPVSARETTRPRSSEVARFEASLNAVHTDPRSGLTVEDRHDSSASTQDGTEEAAPRFARASDAMRFEDVVSRDDAAPPPLRVSGDANVETASAVGQPLADLLTQLCSALYVESTHAPGRIVLAFDSALPVASAEFIRDGGRLRLRLWPRDRQS